MIAAGQAADARRWDVERQQAAQVDPSDFGLDINKPEPSAPTEADRLGALFDHRTEDREFQAAALAAGLVPARIAPAEAAAAQQVAEQPKPAVTQAGVTWDQLRQAWELERKPAPKTIIEAKSSIDLFVSQTDKPVDQLVKRDYTQFKTWLLAEPGRGGGMLSAASATKRLSLLKTILAMAADNDVLPSSPAIGVSVKGGKDSNRLPFSLANLDMLFTPENLPESQAGRFRMLIALYSGAGLNEICQLRGTEVVIEDGVPCFSIDNMNDDQSVKTSGSRRLVPLHPVVIDAGIV